MISEIQVEAQREEVEIRESRSKIAQLTPIAEQLHVQLRSVEEENDRLCEQLAAKKAARRREGHCLECLYLDRLLPNKNQFETAIQSVVDQETLPSLASSFWPSRTEAMCHALESLGSRFQQLDDALASLIAAVPAVSHELMRPSKETEAIDAFCGGSLTNRGGGDHFSLTTNCDPRDRWFLPPDARGGPDKSDSFAPSKRPRSSDCECSLAHDVHEAGGPHCPPAAAAQVVVGAVGIESDRKPQFTVRFERNTGDERSLILPSTLPVARHISLSGATAAVGKARKTLFVSS